jgi:tetratricopeptide (TPR) repeat protein
VRPAILLPSILFSTALVNAQSPAPAPHGHSTHWDGAIGYVQREVLQLPIKLRNNVGHVDDPVTTSNPEAQAFYNQGVACLHNYIWIDAARSFNQALRLDPQLAMAHVGLFRVYINLNDLPAAADATAKKLWSHADPGLPELSRLNATLQAGK